MADEELLSRQVELLLELLRQQNAMLGTIAKHTRFRYIQQGLRALVAGRRRP